MKTVSVDDGRSDWLGALMGIEPALQLALLAALAALLLRAGWRRLHPRRRGPCRWKRDRIRRRSGMERWHCMACGVDAFTQDGRAPKECKRTVREVGL